ncbi:hypothetical protein BFX80_07580 [Cobetia marina]|nr:hypothetical protein BFX80_07580 [Cobetia marina]
MDSSRDEIIASIKSVIHNDDEKIAKLIIYLLKIETLKKSEILVYNKIFNKDKPDPFQFSIHKVVMLVMNIFLEDFKDKEVYVALGECYEVIYADFDVVAAALTHIFHNAQKYILPKSKMDISFQKVDGFLEVTFRMTSLRVKEDERIRIFEKDYSGVEATKLNRNGTGLGLWIVKELLKTMDGKIEFKSNVRPENKRTQLGVKYEVNEFKLSFTTAK